MKDKITWEDHNLFDYINAIEFLYVPDIDDYEYQINIEIVKSNTNWHSNGIFNIDELWE